MAKKEEEKKKRPSPERFLSGAGFLRGSYPKGYIGSKAKKKDENGKKK